MKNTLAAIFSISALVSACGGGGGGAASAPSEPPDPRSTIYDFTTASEIKPDGLLILSSKAGASGAQYKNDPETEEVIVRLDERQGYAGTVYLYFVDGALKAVNLTGVDEYFDNAFAYAENFEPFFNLENGDIIRSDGTVFIAERPDLNDEAVIVDPRSAGYEYQTFGAWLTGRRTGKGVWGVASWGARENMTGLLDMPAPKSTTATYNGDTIGYAKVGDDIGRVQSSLKIETDFSAADFETTNTKFAAVPGRFKAAPELDLDGSGWVVVDGPSFLHGSLVGKVDTSDVQLRGRFHGTFFGPNAEEVGGSFEVKDIAGSGESDVDVVYTGSFGAKR